MGACTTPSGSPPGAVTWTTRLVASSVTYFVLVKELILVPCKSILAGTDLIMTFKFI